MIKLACVTCGVEIEQRSATRVFHCSDCAFESRRRQRHVREAADRVFAGALVVVFGLMVIALFGTLFSGGVP